MGRWTDRQAADGGTEAWMGEPKGGRVGGLTGQAGGCQERRALTPYRLPKTRCASGAESKEKLKIHQSRQAILYVISL